MPPRSATNEARVSLDEKSPAFVPAISRLVVPVGGRGLAASSTTNVPLIGGFSTDHVAPPSMLWYICRLPTGSGPSEPTRMPIGGVTAAPAMASTLLFAGPHGGPELPAPVRRTPCSGAATPRGATRPQR